MRGADRGETLLELIVAVAVMGVAVVAIVGGIGTAIMMSDVHRKQATAGELARTDAETLVSNGYQATCGYTVPSPTGYTTTLAVSSWNGSAFASGTCSDSGLHKVSIQVASADGRATQSVAVVIRESS